MSTGRSRRTRRAAAGAALLAALASVGSTPAPVAAPLLDPHGDRVMAHVTLASPAGPLGEVRVIQRGDADVVQTLLYTTLLKRVVAEIGKKERANWPDGQPQHAAAERYLAALEQVADDLRGRPRPSRRPADRRLRLFIDFVLSDTAALVAIGTYAADDSSAAWRVTRSEPLVVLELPRDYVRRNLRLIAEDSFQRHGAALDELLAPLRRASDRPVGSD